MRSIVNRPSCALHPATLFDLGVLLTSIIDDGSGIPHNQLKQVIQLFYRLESSCNRDIGGIGLGLAIAASIAEAHGRGNWIVQAFKKYRPLPWGEGWVRGWDVASMITPDSSGLDRVMTDVSCTVVSNSTRDALTL